MSTQPEAERAGLVATAIVVSVVGLLLVSRSGDYHVSTYLNPSVTETSPSGYPAVRGGR